MSWRLWGRTRGQTRTVTGSQDPGGEMGLLGGVSAPQEEGSGARGHLQGFLRIHQQPRELLVPEDGAEAALEETLQLQDGLNIRLVLGNGGKNGEFQRAGPPQGPPPGPAGVARPR